MEAACDKNSNNSVFEIETKLSSTAINDNEANDELTENNSLVKSELDCNNQFHDDLGPETDVDGQDDFNSTETTNKFEPNSITDVNMSNAVKSASLESKIIQHLSEQNKDFLVSNNPFSNDTFDGYHEKIPQECIDNQSDDNSAEQVDNKIIDALETLEMAKEEKEKCQIENIVHDLIDNLADDFTLPEKMDCFHEKQCTISQPETEEPQNHASMFETSANEEEPYHTDCTQFSTVVTGETCIAEESDDEEEEWNYFKGDKKHIKDAVDDQTNDTNETCEQLSNDVQEPPTAEIVIGQHTQPEVDTSIDRLTSMNEENNLWMETQFETESTEKTEVSGISLTQKTIESSDIKPVIDEETTLLNFHCEKQDLSDENQGSTLSFDIKPSREELFSVEETAVYDTEATADTSVSEIRATDDNNIGRPDNLALEMASKLNPEAKEFVPIGSPTRSDPASPVASVPPVLQNPLLILSKDVVIAQSPKKDINTMDNIDVPAEDDFQQEMNDRPHEFESVKEYTNGTVEAFHLHSPASDPSYQEINLKEAMQCDEKLDNDYSDEKQTLIDEIASEVPSKSSLTLFSKEPDAMNISFYEERNEPMLTSSSDELNKVHLLPDDDPLEQCSVNETQNCLLENEVNTNGQQLLSNKNEVSKAEETNVLEVEKTINKNNIFDVASQVVNDVTALVDQMQIDKHIDRLVPDSEPATLLHSSHEIMPTDNSDNLPKEELNEEDNRDILINLDNQRDSTQHKDFLKIDVNVESVHPNLIETDVVSPISKTNEYETSAIEPAQHEINTENENFNANAKLVSTPTIQDIQPTMEQGYVPNAISENPFEEDSLKLKTCSTSSVEQPDLNNTILADDIIDQTSIAIDDLPTPVVDSNESKLVSNWCPNETSVPLEKVTSALKTTTAKPSVKVPTQINADKKVPSVSNKLNAKAPKVASTTTKTVSTVKKSASTVAQAISTVDTKKLITANKVSSASTTRFNATNKAATEKKPLLGITKKPASVSATVNNGDLKSTVLTRKVPTTAQKPVSTKSTTTSGINTRPTSTASKTAVPPKLMASSTRPTSSPPSKTSTVSTSGTVKPRTISSKTTGKTASTTTMTAAVTARTSVTGNSTNKISSVQSTAVKNSVTSKTSIAASRTTSTTNRVSATTNRLSSTTKTGGVAVGGQRKSSATPNKKLNASPTNYTNKTTNISKITSENRPQSSPQDNDTKNLLDFDKQVKNDCNQLITKNGIDSQMIVIDSAAD